MTINTWGRIASLIATAKVNDVEPFAYFKATHEAIAAGHPANRIDDLLPWNFQPSSWSQVLGRHRLQIGREVRDQIGNSYDIEHNVNDQPADVC